MSMLKLIQDHGHLFINLTAGRFLLDTGAPTSFGRGASVELDGVRFDLPQSYMGLTADVFSTHVGCETAGILGGDILNQFDLLFDGPQEQATISCAQLACAGEALALEFFMDIPILQTTIAGTQARMFFDTGAQISYFQGEALRGFPADGTVTDFYPGMGPFLTGGIVLHALSTVTDFYPGMGPFSTDTFRVPIQLGATLHELRCGQLPELLAMTLMMANTEGIIGNELIRDRVVGYFPRRHCLILS